MSEEGQQFSVLRDRIEELLFRLRRDDERMNAQLESGLAGIFSTNAIAREDVMKALEDMLRIDSEPPAGKVRVSVKGSMFGVWHVVECALNDGIEYDLPQIGFGASVRVEWTK